MGGGFGPITALYTRAVLTYNSPYLLEDGIYGCYQYFSGNPGL